ncbi:MAG: DUF4097 domain-containing protein [Clostridiales bacterium]|jgi:lia operon protein LiaG|nr:DUF4097 domain-containing protein [Clostridiales bacterium]
MKRGFIIAAISLWTIVVVAIILLAITISNGRFNQMTVSSADALLRSGEVSIGNTENIIIETSRQSIYIRKTTGDKIKITQYGSSDTRNEELFLVSSSGDDIHIYIKREFRMQFFNFIDRERLIVEIPEDFYGNLDVSASSGSIRVEDEFTLKNTKLHTSSGSTHISKSISVDNLNMRSTSGSIRLNGDVKAKDISAETTSGSIGSDMEIKADGKIELRASSGSINMGKDITAKDLYAYTNSGGLRMENVYVENFDLKCTSGSIRVNSISGAGYAKTSSGSIQIALSNPNGDVDLNTSSGSIRLGLEPSLEFTLTAETNSGGIKTSFPTQKNERGNYATANVGDNPTVNITARASSGGIRIETN